MTYRLGGPTCLSGDVIGDYSFDAPLREGDRLVFGDMAIYTTCKNNTFNGMSLPSIWVASFDGKSFIIHFTQNAPEEFTLPALQQRVRFQPAIMALSDAGEGKMWISQERTARGATACSIH